MSTKSRWEISQELERKYNESSKPKAWGVPYSFKYWADHIDLVDFDGINLEVGCGQDGFWRFSEQIIGSDSLNFGEFGKNFVQANVEQLPFKDNYFRDCYSMNMLDHTENPQKALKEMIRVTSHRVYVICNAFSSYMQPIMNRFDAIHPYHFTDEDLIKLIPDTVQITKARRKDFVDMEVKTAQFLPKMKLLLAQALGTHRLLLHLDKVN